MKKLKVLTVTLFAFLAMGIGTSFASESPVKKIDTGKEEISFVNISNNISFILGSSKSVLNPNVDIKIEYGVLCRMTVSGTTDTGIKYKISGRCAAVRRALKELNAY